MKTGQRRPIGILVKVGACLGAGLLASPAVADSVVTYSGYACVGAEIAGNQGGLIEGAAFGSYTRCPLTRINSDDTTTGISTILVRYQDSSPTASIVCYAESCTSTAGTCSQTSSQSSGAAFTGANYMNLGGVTAYSNGYAYIHCDLPTNGGNLIYSYRATD